MPSLDRAARCAYQLNAFALVCQMKDFQAGQDLEVF